MTRGDSPPHPPPFNGGEQRRQSVQLEYTGWRAECERPACDARFGMARRSPHQRAQTHDEFFDPDRFCQVVVCSRLEAIDLFGPAVAGSQNQYRQMAAFLSPCAQDATTGDLGEAE